MPQQTLDEKSIFNAARSIAEPQARYDYVLAACGANRDLKRRILCLLNAHESETNFLASPYIAGDLVEATPLSLVGERVGAYEFVGILGEGGMGTVYLGRQSEPIRRDVAIKVIKPGLDSKAVLSSFEGERRALAMMDHPSITKILDAGAMGNGHPYFIMELVQGVPITEYCFKNQLPLDKCLALVIQVCGALQHAHQRGIIHRDIKPSNVLVTEIDEQPVPKVIDFGIARATEQGFGAEKTDTAWGSVVGTVEYMSPEQAELGGNEIDVRSDVYSLGVLLYEIITGYTPLDRSALRASSLDEVLRMVREVEPRTPSARLSEEISSTRLPECERLNRRKWTAIARSELDWIVLKAIAKDKMRRYESPHSLATDLANYLAGRPVNAHPPSRIYLLRKFTGRHRVAVAMSALVLLAVVVGTTIAMTQAIRATLAEQKSKDDARKLATELALSDAVLTFLERDILTQASTVAQSANDFAPVPEITIAEALERATSRVGSRFGQSPIVEARVRAAIGNAFGSMGRYKEASQQLTLSRELYRALPDANLKAIASVEQNLAYAKKKLGDYRGAIEILNSLHSLQNQLRTQQAELLDTLLELGEMQILTGEVVRGLDTLEGVARQVRGITGLSDGFLIHFRQVMSSAYDRAERHEDALAYSRQEFEDASSKYGPNDPRRIIATSNFALALRQNGQYREALALLEPLREAINDAFEPTSPNRIAILSNLGLILFQFDRQDEGVEVILEAARICEGDKHALSPPCLISACNLCESLLQLGRSREAGELMEKFCSHPRWPMFRDQEIRFRLLTTLSRAYRNQRLFEDALRTLELARASILETDVAQLRVLQADLAEIGILHSAGKASEASSLASMVLCQIYAMRPSESRALLTAMDRLSVDYISELRYSEAVPVLECATFVAQSHFGVNHRETLIFQDTLARAYFGSYRFNEALELARSVWSAKRKLLGDLDVQTLATAEFVAYGLSETGHHKEAIQVYNDVLLSLAASRGEAHSLYISRTIDRARALFKAEMHSEAAAALESLVSRMKSATKVDAKELLRAQFLLARIQAARGEVSEGIALAESLRDVMDEEHGTLNLRTMIYLGQLASMYAQAGETSTALDIIKEVEERYAQLKPLESISEIQLIEARGEVYFSAMHYEQSLPDLKRSFEVARRRGGSLVDSGSRLILTYEALGYTKEADEVKAALR